MYDEEVSKTPHNLAFKVAKFSSEDVSMRAKDLLQLGPGVKGWACSKYSSYPQELIFQLMHGSKLTEIQLLAHQYMIPEQIDIYIGDIQPGKEHASQNCKYARLGEVFMSNNEHTQFSGRELKYINVSCIGRYLKLSFRQNHMNKLNIHNQVALVAINIVGYEVEGHVNSAFLDFNTRLEYKRSNANWIVHYGQDLAFSMYVDVHVAKTIKQMEERRAMAKRDEQTEYAAKLKKAVQELRKAGEKIGKYEIEKRAAIDHENFDKAKAKKQQLESYRIDVYHKLDIEGLLEKAEIKQKSNSKAYGSQNNSESARATISSRPTRTSSAPPRRHRTKTSTAPERTETSSAPPRRHRTKTSSAPERTETSTAPPPKLKTPPFDISLPSTPRLRTKRIFVPLSEKHNRLTLASGSKSDQELDLDSSEFNKSQEEFPPKGSNRRSGFHKQKFANIFNSF